MSLTCSISVFNDLDESEIGAADISLETLCIYLPNPSSINLKDYVQQTVRFIDYSNQFIVSSVSCSP